MRQKGAYLGDPSSCFSMGSRGAPKKVPPTKSNNQFDKVVVFFVKKKKLFEQE